MKNRTKSETKTKISPWCSITLYDKFGNQTGYYPFEAGVYDDQLNVSKKITYEVGPRSDISKNCAHHERTVMMFPFSGTRYAVTDNYAVDVRHTKSAEADAISPTLPFDGVDSEFNARAFSALAPDLEQSVNLGQFLAELSDITRFKGLITKWRGFTKKIAEGHLSWSFGVKPFYSDVKSLYDVLTNHQKIIEDFFGRRGKTQKRYYTEGAQYETGTTSEHTINAHTKVFCKYSDRIQYFATMTYTYDCPDIDSYWDFIKVMRQMLGLRLSQSLVWELIPFSFVLDWFFRVGDYLERFQESLWPVTVEVIDYTITRRRTNGITWYLKTLPSTNDSVWKTTVIKKSIQKSYHRRRALPDSGTTFINRGQYGLNQLALSASLLRTLR